MTETAEIQRLMNDARVHLPGALDKGIRQEMFNVLDEFLQGSKIWQEDLDFNLVVGTKVYNVTSDEDGAITLLLWVLNADEIAQSATMPIPGTIKLGWEPTQVETLTATVALTVIDPVDADTNPVIPTWLLKKYRAGILDGLLARLMSQPAKPYSNERMAVYHGRRFRNVIAGARADAMRRNTYRAQAWRFPFFT